MEKEFLNKKIGIVVSFGTGTAGAESPSILMSYTGTLMDVDDEYIKVNVTGVEQYPYSLAIVKFKQNMGITIFKKKNIILMCEA